MVVLPHPTGSRVFAFGAALTLWAAALAAQPSARVTGIVEDSSGTPVPGVRVAMIGAAATQFALTDADGRFAFVEPPDGEYDVTASAQGFAPATARVRLAGAESVAVVLKLWVLAFEKITVTAAKTGERDLQATPLAVSVLSGAELQRARARTVEEIAGLAPSLSFSQNTGFSQLTIRGIGTNAVFTGADPSSAMYVDGVYFARPAMALSAFVDLERVEVLRGPQGTLYGRNAVGGALNVITRPPTEAIEAAASIGAGNLGAFRGEAQLRGPIVPGKLRGSAAVLRGVEQGYVRDLDHPDHPLGGEDVVAARAKLQYVFGPRADLLLAGDVTHQDPAPLTYAKVLAVKPGFEVNNPPGLHEVRASTLAWSRNLQYGAAARLTLRLAQDTTLTSLTAYRKLDYDLLADTDVTELELTASHVHEIQHQWSEELTLARQRPGRSWVAGVFLFDDLDRQPTSILLGGPGLENRLDPEVGSTSAAVFGQATVGLTRRLSATAGLRYTRERKTIDNDGSLYTQDLPTALVAGSAYSYSDAMTHAAWTPKLGLEWHAGERTLAYLSATRGFKSGGFNISSPEPGRGFAPEWAWAYEGGLKTVFASGRATLDLAAFHTDYEDLQVQIAIRPGVLDISNAAAAGISGFEAESALQLARSLRVGGYLAWLDARYDRYLAVGVGGVTGDVTGNRLSNAPCGRAGCGSSGASAPAGSAGCRFEPIPAGRAPSSSRPSTTRFSVRVPMAS